jgi:superfamily I DNA and/or RNA helicase
MGYKSYLTKQYEHSHENSFFRVFSLQLRNRFKDIDGLNILIGNLSCNGHQIDALFIASGKIIVIDFKNYGGTLTFSENNPWQMATGNDFVFVQGGGGIRNPYHQVNAYRFSLMQFLGDRQNDFLDPNHQSFNLGHLSTLVLFQQPVVFDHNLIPQKIQKYFGVADNNNCITTILDRNSIQLNLSDVEIEKILSVLDIQEENLYDETQETETPLDVIQPNAAERLEQVRKELNRVDFRNKTEIEKLLLYYQTIISLERVKEPKVTEEHSYHVNWGGVNESILLNLENHPQFHVRFQKMMGANFKKNIFIGVNVLFNSQTLTFLYNIIPHGDILNHNAIESNIKDFTLYTKPFEDRNYPEELIEELTSAINQKDTITEKLEILKGYLDGVIELVENVTIAFSEENPYTSQLLSEIKTIGSRGLVSEGSFLEKFLKKEPIPNSIQQIDSSELIEISAMNVNQKKAIEFSFNQPLTVITGPPGTGKTQVVLNILANAIIHNKKVLLASKNNQAVDNVKERLANIINEPNFFLRFGSKKEIVERTKPMINSYVTRIHDHLIPDNSEILLELENSRKEKLRIIRNSVLKLEKRKQIEREIPVLELGLLTIKNEFENWLAANSKELINVFSNHTKESLSEVYSKNISLKKELIAKYKGFGKLLFDFSSKNKYASKLTSFFESLLPDLKALAIRQGIQIKLNDLRNGAAIISECEKLSQFIALGLELQDKNNNLLKRIEAEETKVQELKSESENIREAENELKNTRSENQQILDETGLSLLDELVSDRIRLGNAAEINKFKDYIPDNIPWQSMEIPKFVETTKNFLETFNITAITSLSIKSAFPLADELFDLVVIDEASQCDVASAIPLVLRAKQLVVIGDPLQLKHITKVQGYEEKYITNTLGIDKNLRLDYVNESLFDYCYNLSITSRSNSVFLKEHFRCHPEIITYSNKAFYGPLRGQELEILTSPDNYKIEPKGIFWKNTLGQQHPQRNSNQMEVDASIDLACNLADKHPDITIGITTPFRHQADELKEAIPQNYRARIKAEAVHSFQGDERDIMIFSLVVSRNSPSYKAEWINNKVPYLINVAVTRARNTLYIIGNADYCRTLPIDSPLGILVRYVNDVNPIEK